MAIQQQAYSRVGSSGLTTKKSVAAISKDVFQVTYEFSSDVDHAIGFRLTEDLPDEIHQNEVGFHPTARKKGSVRPGELEYTDILDPEEESRTVYAIRGIPEAIAHELRRSRGFRGRDSRSGRRDSLGRRSLIRSSSSGPGEHSGSNRKRR